ncbi:hypothetical protein EVAR_87718_1 [Eumeta japonica]|uniref:DUF5641 domain-containing protein n=1 Tax=Eumeta variegata TaxID=151549 RepID=A0A4C1TES0_EUMVA|nr:hypothetical protein EVAR_87718_1 [Eumeta japonica]
MGGAWERLRSVKTALAATLREEPREEVLHTLLLGSRAHCQPRPLTEVDVEPAEAEGLTPNHFLIGRSRGLPQRATLTTTCSGPANWRTCQRLADHFWLREYLPTWCPPGARRPYMPRAPAEGDIVLIVDSSSPRYRGLEAELRRPPGS